MAWTTPGTAVAGDVLTAAFLNTNVRDNTNALRDTTGIVPPACKVRRVAVQAIANGATTAINFDTEDFDTNAMFAATANFITIKTAGIYIVTAGLVLTANATGNRALIIFLNPTVTGSGDTATLSGGTEITGSTHAVQSSTTAATTASTVYNFALNDVIRVGFFQNSTISLNTSGAPFLSVAMLGATS